MGDHIMLFGTPIIFGPANTPLFGQFHVPKGPGLRSVAVVLCNPLGHEALSVHRTYRHLAGKLASNGFPTLRFDHDGTGNSPASSSDPRRMQAWLGGIANAVAEVRARSGAERVALVGVRFGAALAAQAASELKEVDQLVLWGPVLSGPQHVRELRAYRLIKGGRDGRKSPSGGASAGSSDGSEEIAGHLLAGETLSQMASIDLQTAGHRFPRRVLLLSRKEGVRDETRFAEQLKTGGVDVRVAPDPGFGAMMRDDPYDTVVPKETLDSIVSWLEEAAPAASLTQSPAPRSSTGSQTAAPELRVVQAHLPPLRETALRFGEADRLFGILTEPERTHVNRPAVLILNVGANHHVGPHRLNVELARDIAAQGFTTLRFDASGLGDSAPLAGQPENRIYQLEAVADVRAAMALLTERCGSNRFVLIGLCSGAYVAFHTAVSDPRVVGQVLLSPFAFEWKEGDPVTPHERDFKGYRSTRFYLRSLLTQDTWRRALKGKVNVGGISTILFERGLERLDHVLPQLSALVRRRRRPSSEIEKSFRALCERGVESLVVFSFDDGGIDMLTRYLGPEASKLKGRSNFSLEILEDADHTFTASASRQKLHALLRRYLSLRFS